MEIGLTPRRPGGEPIVPMINVVFLLLVFFLMTAAIAPPEPVPVTPPQASEAAATEAGLVLTLDATGTLRFEDAAGDAAVAALAGREGPLLVRADRAAQASALAALLPRLAALGFTDVGLAVLPR